MKSILLLSTIIVSVFLLETVNGHGMVLDPVNRASRWRYDSSAPTDYDDSQAFCGGFYTQWEVYGGKCGFCGDPYNLAVPRPHEHGGTYGRGVISKTYRTGGQMPVAVLLTANHQGYFKFNICNMDGQSLESDSCFNRYPVKLTNGNDKHYITGYEVGWYNVTLQLPSTLSCNHCVLQWTYNVGNSWGVCENGQGAMGCGAQENFRSCSDIRIISTRDEIRPQIAVDESAHVEEPIEIDEITDNNIDFIDTNCN